MIAYTVVVNEDGNQYWFKDGKYHREDGPAVIWPDGNKAYFINGKLHREDGPAITYSDGYESYYLDGEHITKEEYTRCVHHEMAKWVFPNSIDKEKTTLNDGRPCNTDIFLVHLMEHEDDHYDLRDRIKSWIEGAWDEALEDLPELKG